MPSRFQFSRKSDHVPATTQIDPDSIRTQIMGQTNSIRSVFGERPLLYFDYTATGRGIHSIESYMAEKVLPLFSNTHTLSNAASRQTTFFRNEARDIIKTFYNLSFEDALIFTGNGATSASNLCCRILSANNFRSLEAGRPTFVETRWKHFECSVCKVICEHEADCRQHVLSAEHLSRVRETPQPPQVSRVVVFCDPVNHHSCFLPFKELIHQHPLAEEPLVSESHYVSGEARGAQLEFCFLKLKNHMLDVDHLETLVRQVQGQAKVILLLCGRSNVTGFNLDTGDVGQRVKAIDPSATIVLDLASRPLMSLRPGVSDMALVSPHKLLGGVGTPGLLMARKSLLVNETPVEVGGGVVFYVSRQTHTYIENREEREEAGTPNILGCIRAGLTYKLHERLNPHRLESLEDEHAQYLFDHLRPMTNLVLLGNPSRGYKSISFLVRHQQVFLHYSFVVALLSDLFGIQIRGGCACAGPYGQSLLGMSPELVAAYDQILHEEPEEVLRPGFCRLSLNFTHSREDLDYLVKALAFVCQHGYKLVELYKFDRLTGEYEHRQSKYDNERNWLADFDFIPSEPPAALASRVPSFEACLTQADELLKNLADSPKCEWKASPRAYQLCWFYFPGLASESPFDPQRVALEVPTPAPVCFIHPRNPEDDPSRPPVVFADRALKPVVPKFLRNLVGRAICDFQMIQEGDRVLLAISGGKDSLSMIHLIKAFQRHSPLNFTIAAATVDPMAQEYNPEGLKDYMAALGIPYYYERQDVVNQAKDCMSSGRASICSFCSRMRRGILYGVMERHDFNVLMLGQHLDDICESFLMSIFHNGMLRSMKANYPSACRGKPFRIARPLIFVREKYLTKFAQDNEIPIINENCPACFAQPKERARMKLLLSKEEFIHAGVFKSMLRGLLPILHRKTDRPTEDPALTTDQPDEDPAFD